MKFTFASGSRPLDGYTVKRGLGHGGFGEVYYAISDGGKEVALKLIRQNLEVELRGIAQCLNLKHPNLVQLYDLRRDNEGNHWVIMEYVAGESLSSILQRHPHGLPLDLARRWFLDMARAIACLHDNGIVHRDLKPGNIFLEQGIIRVGDYGLCKLISESHHKAQTQGVGTVHYMAPEISTGNYGKSVDIYAAGVILYEMLTGRVPFEGDSHGEILMKHLSAPPDLSRLPKPYDRIVGKALAKNPADRYATINEMIQEVERLERPQTAPVPAAQAATPEAAPASLPIATPASTRLTWREVIRFLAKALAVNALLLIGLVAPVMVVFQHDYNRPFATDMWPQLVQIFCLATLIELGALVLGRWWFEKPTPDNFVKRISFMAYGLLIGLCAFWLAGGELDQLLSLDFRGASAHASEPLIGDDPDDPLVKALLDRKCPPLNELLLVWSYFLATMFFIGWWKLSDPMRLWRINPLALVWAFAVSFVGTLFVEKAQHLPAGSSGTTTNWWLAIVLAALVTQLVSPWFRALPKALRPARLRFR
ncbi:MAG: hypothetical protein C4297_11100 [Gemmataceae bacterium]